MSWNIWQIPVFWNKNLFSLYLCVQAFDANGKICLHLVLCACVIFTHVHMCERTRLCVWRPEDSIGISFYPSCLVPLRKTLTELAVQLGSPSTSPVDFVSVPLFQFPLVSVAFSSWVVGKQGTVLRLYVAIDIQTPLLMIVQQALLTTEHL